jgi:hypothetical protein
MATPHATALCEAGDATAGRELDPVDGLAAIPSELRDHAAQGANHLQRDIASGQRDLLGTHLRRETSEIAVAIDDCGDESSDNECSELHGSRGLDLLALG